MSDEIKRGDDGSPYEVGDRVFWSDPGDGEDEFGGTFSRWGRIVECHVDRATVVFDDEGEAEVDYGELSRRVDEDGKVIRTPVEETFCQCGEVTGVTCEWTGPVEHMVTVEFMPLHLRGSHEVAGNRGSYPHNGAERLVCSRDCAYLLVDADPNWTAIIDG